MADSIKLQTLKALTVFLEGTAPTVEFPHALTNAVFRGRTIFGDSDPPTVISILEAPQGSFSVYAGGGQARQDRWQLLLQGWCPDDKVNPSDPVYAMLDAVERRLDRIMLVNRVGDPVDPVNHRLGNLIVEFKHGPGVVRPPAEGVSSKAFFFLPIEVRLASDAG